MSDFPNSNADIIFKNVLNSMKNDKVLSAEAINLWFDNCVITGIDSDNVYLSVESESRMKAIKNHYEDILSKYFSYQLGYAPNIVISTDKSLIKRIVAESDESDYITDESNAIKDGNIFTKNNIYTFENFVVGSSNTFAYAAACSIAEKGSMEFNPFFVYGPSGVGKTHLLYSIANRILELHPKKVIVYVKGDEFTNDLIESLKEGTTSIFRQKYRNTDVLIIDDIQFIAGKKQTQEEFFHTFNALYEKKKQIIFSSDRSPSEMNTLEDRLRARFSSGLIQDIQLPDFELKLAILRKKSEAAGLNLSDDILEFLADKLHSNIREIEGVIKKLSAMFFLNGLDINMDTVKANVSVFLKKEEPAKQIVTKVISETGKKFNVPVEEILGRKRDKQISLARNVSMYIIRNLTSLSLPEIGTLFERKHSTVKSNIDYIKEQIQSNIYLEKQVDEIIKAVRS
ncbi:MAG: chromosomal replication initiator protein DnaA [Clostridia bacterium]|nr:chromosomal replication initiator protein DnaA [Clostridia bacterium]